jgi:hypothetical protein
MAHFYGTVRGNRGEASRTGSKASGMRVSANGWDIGATIELSHDPKTGKDTVVISITRGSHDSSPIYTVERTEGD